MNYKGYEIKAERFTLPFGGRVSGQGIFKDGKRLSIAEDKELAQRWIDQQERREHERQEQAKVEILPTVAEQVRVRADDTLHRGQRVQKDTGGGANATGSSKGRSKGRGAT